MSSAKRVLAAIVALLVVFSFALAVIGSGYSPNTDIPSGFVGSHVVVDGVPLRVVQTGAGRDVLFIHGSPGSVEDFDAVAAALSGSFRVTRFDRPGHGFSGDLASHSMATNAELALALVDALKLDHVIVVGHSYGGSTALAMALRNSPKIDRYVIIDSAVYRPIRKTDALMHLLVAPLIGVGFATAVAPLFAPGKIQKGLTAQFAPRQPPDGFVAQRTMLWNVPKVTHALSDEALGAAAELAVMSPHYGSIHRPVTILAEADEPARKATAERLHADIPGSVLRLVPNTGHYIQIEKPGEVIDAIVAAAGN